ncbi:hypothetical protein QP273_25465 [Escherichia coli]|nr:hypothetical protein [Escherichia coli]
MKQQYQTRYELLHENYQKWLTGFTRHAVSWGVCHPNIYYFHNLTPGWVLDWPPESPDNQYHLNK